MASHGTGTVTYSDNANTTCGNSKPIILGMGELTTEGDNDNKDD